MRIGLHHHPEQGLIDPPAAFQQRGEERPGPQLRDASFEVTGRGGQGSRTGAVALRGAGPAAFVRPGADRGGQLGFDQRLIQAFGCRADPVIDIGGLQCLEEFEQGRLVQGHRVAFLFNVILGGFTHKIHAVAPRAPAPRRRAQSLRPVTPLAGTSPNASEGVRQVKVTFRTRLVRPRAEPRRVATAGAQRCLKVAGRAHPTDRRGQRPTALRTFRNLQAIESVRFTTLPRMPAHRPQTGDCWVCAGYRCTRGEPAPR